MSKTYSTRLTIEQWQYIKRGLRLRKSAWHWQLSAHQVGAQHLYRLGIYGIAPSGSGWHANDWFDAKDAAHPDEWMDMVVRRVQARLNKGHRCIYHVLPEGA